MFYTVLALLLFAGGAYHLLKGTPESKGERVALFLCFWLVAGLAYQTGVDWRIYGRVYESVVPLYDAVQNGGFYASSGIHGEIGYGFLSSLVKVFTDEFQYVMLACNLISAVFFFKGLKRYTTHFYLSLLLYLSYTYLILNMSGIRQAVAVSIVFYALQFAAGHKFWKYGLWIAVAATFHASALILLPLYPILNRRLSKKAIYTVLGIGMILYLLRISLLTQSIATVSELSGNPFILKIYLYITLAEDTPPGISPKVFLNLLMLVLFLVYRDKMSQHNPYIDTFINLFVVYIFIFEYLWDTGDVGGRLYHYFILGLAIALPELLYALRYLSNRLICLSYILVLALWSNQLIFFEYPSAKSYSPYQNYLIYKTLDIESTGNERLDESLEQ